MKRFMKRMNEKKGFTLAELLIVVAIIAVLVAIAIPVFTSQLNKSKRATDLANARSIYAELQADYLANGEQKASVSGTATAGSGGSITVTDADGKTNKYEFSLSAVTITLGTTTAGPTVSVTDDEGTTTSFPAS